MALLGRGSCELSDSRQQGEIADAPSEKLVNVPFFLIEIPKYIQFATAFSRSTYGINHTAALLPDWVIRARALAFINANLRDFPAHIT